MDPTRNPIPIKPATLLWNYELQRSQRELTNHLIQAKKQTEETERLNASLSTCLQDLSTIVVLVTRSLDNQTPQGQQQLLHLGPQLREIVEPLFKATKTMVNRNEDLLATIYKLRGLREIVNRDPTIAQRPPPGLELPHELPQTPAAPSEDPASSPITQAMLNRSASRPNPSRAGKELNASDRAITAQILLRATNSAEINRVMQQKGRPLGEYFDAAHEFRRQSLLPKGAVNNDHVLIEAFLDGLDSQLSRRRFIHWLRKEHWTWNFVFHFAQVLVMEEEYMAKQEYAMEHKFEDGSVLFPDGQRIDRFHYLPPITDADLTPSDDDD